MSKESATEERQEVMGLRETLEAATPGPWEAKTLWDKVVIGTRDFRVAEIDADPEGPRVEADARLISLAPELAALVLDMGEELEAIDAAVLRNGFTPRKETRALLARLDQLGAADETQLGKGQT